MFYAPWCGHCKRLGPTWEELATKYNSNSEIKISKVDCTMETSLCSDQGVTGYPTLKLYEDGVVEGTKYRGARDVKSLEKFISDQLGKLEEQQAKSRQKLSPEPQTGLLELTDEDFYRVTNRGDHFVKFYAPWCGHCRNLAPTWEKLAESLAYDPSIRISKVDCTVHREVCKDMDIKGYPTLLWIQDGKQVKQYQGGRSHEELKEFIEEMRKEQAEHPEQRATLVAELTEVNFDAAIQQGLTFIMFHAPWCQHCKALSPVWDLLSQKLAPYPEVTIAKVDCTREEDLCKNNQVEGYPTVVLFKQGRRVAEYSGTRDLESLLNFVRQHQPLREEL